MVHVADGGGLGAAGELAVLVALDDGGAQVRWDGAGGPAEVEGLAGGAEGGAEDGAAQVGGEAAGAGEQVEAPAQDGGLQPSPGGFQAAGYPAVVAAGGAGARAVTGTGERDGAGAGAGAGDGYGYGALGVDRRRLPGSRRGSPAGRSRGLPAARRCGFPAARLRGLSRGPSAGPSRGPGPAWPSCGPPGWPPCGPPAWPWWWVVSQTVVSWSSTCQSICPVTIVVSTASHAAASAAGPVRYAEPGPAAAIAGVQVRSSTEPPGGRRNSPRSMCTFRCGGCPSRPGIICPPISRRHASSIASWRRCAAVRVSSGPARCPNASSTTLKAAAQAGVRSACSRPAPPKVVPSHSARSSNPSLSASGVAWARSSISRPSRARSC